MVSKEAISLVAVWLHRRKQCHWVICLSGNPKAICLCTTDTTHNTQIMYQFFCSQVPSSVVERLFNLQELPLLHQKEHNLLLLLDAFFKGWDAQLWHQTASGLLYHEGSRLHINRAATIRIIWRSDSDSESVDFPRYFFSGFLSEQVGRYPLSGMCFLI